MKEHITPSQAKEITKEQFYTLFKNQHWACVNRNDWADYHHKKVTIGKMLYMIKDSNYYGNFSIKSKYAVNSKAIAWVIEGERAIGSINLSCTDLCDGLWEIIKIIKGVRKL